MDPVEETLVSTQNLLCALEQDSTLLVDQQFMSRLTFLRGKHKETTDLLQQQTHPQPKYGSVAATYHKSPGCNHFWSDFIAKDAHSVQGTSHYGFPRPERLAMHEMRRESHSNFPLHLSNPSCGSHFQSDSREGHREYSQFQAASAPVVQDAADVLKRMKSSQIARTRPKDSRVLRKETPMRPSTASEKALYERNGSVETHVMEEDDIVSRERSVSTAESKTKEVRNSPRDTSKRRTPKQAHSSKPMGKKSASVQDLRSIEKEPSVTVPKPFTFTKRKHKGNTYAQKFLQKMLDEKEQKEKELAQQEVSGTPFKAHPVPSTTYKSSNPRVEDQKYADAVRKKLQANLRLQTTMIRSKSMGDVSASHVRPVPASTYIAPVLHSYRRERSASRRAVQLLTEAHTPPGLREHSVRTNLAFHLRHQHCREIPDEGRVRRPSVPDFNRLHREFHEKLQRGMSTKPPTVPVPFNLSENSLHRHRKCHSTSPPRTASRYPSPMKHPTLPVHTTHSSALRAETIRKKLDQDKKAKNKWNAESEERRAEVAVQRQRLLRSISGSRAKELDKIVDQRRQAMKETTREYEKELSDMKKRVMARPLIMEMQTMHGQQNKLEKRFTEAMSSAVTTKVEESNDVDEGSFVIPSLPPHLLIRRSSGGTGETFSVKSKGSFSEKEDYRMEFDTDEERKSISKRSSSRSSKSSKSSSKSRLNSSNGSSSISGSSNGSNGSTSRSSNSSK